jgi:hypothetical protein
MLGLGAALFECLEGFRIETRKLPGLDPLKHGPSGLAVRTGGALSGPVPVLLRTLSLIADQRNARALRRAAGICSIVGSLVTRFAWIHAGHVSVRDWREPLEISHELAASGSPDRLP